MRVQRQPWPESWREPAEQWLTYLAACGRAATTIDTRRLKLAGFARWVDKPPEQVTRTDCETWMGRDHLAAETRKGIRATLASFFEWMHDHGRIAVDPAAKLPHITGSHPRPHPCPDAGIRMAMEGMNERDRLMVRLGAELALRRSEIAQIRGTDVLADTWGGRSLIVNGKGNKQRLVPLTDDLAERIAEAGDGWLFPSRNDGGKSHIMPERVGKIISRRLPEGYSTHSLRHRAATRAYVQTRDLLAVCALLGHTSVATTQRYVAMPPEHLRGMMAALAM
ncbi:phage integrase [Bifidobacterium reuteri DSM 23975]|uniref:Phage integrase n=1 Tax=Bifidobacterium reuteri DSM 23975 TaxID=1437610 RepID=A0A087CMJ2_9BIFI|nr:tyrosine-type recombinase/integrase [Bifidobacterium reuteri]KFI84492.1 phage integrase [Bifidobacterium reuteri DSM 23975]